jgi:ABC-type transport system involved in multi-copper enzyme maturation permease subunit
MTQSLALVLDAYRELNSKKLFWFTLAISGLIALAFAGVGINKDGLSVLWWTVGDFGGILNSDVIPPDQLYKSLFANFGVAFWLGWLATILALVSTSGMIPDFIAGGAVELTLSKPVGRVRLLLTKWAVGLLFVGLQVAAFSLACFLVIGIRGGSWTPRVFLAVPIVLLFFSYLYSVQALLGLLTRSTIASLLLTLLFWLFVFVLNIGDAIVLNGREANAVRRDSLAAKVERLEASTSKRLKEAALKDARAKAEADAKEQGRVLDAAALDVISVPDPTPKEILEASIPVREAREDIEALDKNRPRWNLACRVVIGAKTALPKTGETTALLDRYLVKKMNIPAAEEEEDQNVAAIRRQLSAADRRKVQERIEEIYRTRNEWWILGTSLGFEALVLGAACWIFARRDF